MSFRENPWLKFNVYTLQDGVIGFIISEYDSESEKSRWYHYDRPGNVMDITGENGTLVASCDQDAFGNVFSGSSDGYHLTTKEYDSNIQLYYFYHRWYDPKLGLFLRRDPIARNVLSKVTHLYSYSGNNPVSFFDPAGLKRCRWVRMEKWYEVQKADCNPDQSVRAYSECKLACQKRGAGFINYSCLQYRLRYFEEWQYICGKREDLCDVEDPNAKEGQTKILNPYNSDWIPTAKCICYLQDVEEYIHLLIKLREKVPG